VLLVIPGCVLRPRRRRSASRMKDALVLHYKAAAASVVASVFSAEMRYCIVKAAQTCIFRQLFGYICVLNCFDGI
jgi:hypothetical protein